MSIPRAAITRTAFGWSVFGLLPALHARTAPCDRRSTSASAICERELFPVQRKSTRSGRVGGASLAANAPVAAKSVAVALEVEPVVGVAAVERAAVRGDEAARAEEAQVVRDEVLRLGRPRRSAREHGGPRRRARRAAASGSDAPRAGTGPAAVSPRPRIIHQTRLMYLGLQAAGDRRQVVVLRMDVPEHQRVALPAEHVVEADIRSP